MITSAVEFLFTEAGTIRLYTEIPALNRLSKNSQQDLLSVLNPIQEVVGEGWGWAAKRVPYQLFPCNFYKGRNLPQNFLTFGFNLFATLM